MRRLFVLLIALSLTPAALGFACEMSGAIPQLACCCESEAPESCPHSDQDGATAAVTGPPAASCCSLVVAPAAAAQDETETPTARDPPARQSRSTPTAAKSSDELASAPHFSAHNENAARTYLVTGRLRR